MNNPLGNFTVIIITGPTGSGKSDLAVQLAKHFNCHILSADSRQIYRDIPIGTAAPTATQLAAVPHHLVGTLPIDAYYSAASFENDALNLISRLSAQGEKHLIVCGGSMMYIDALVRGIDELPTITPEIRQRAYRLLEQGGRDAVIAQLQLLDPDYLKIVDINNSKRLVHALEICWQAGVPYSSLRTGTVRERPFRIFQYAINMPRTELFDRINRRVLHMIEAGLENEARSVYHLRHLNSLNTVGFKEMFAWFNGEFNRSTAIARLQKNTRVYAKKQLTWLKKRPDIIQLSPDEAFSEIISRISRQQNFCQASGSEPDPPCANA